MEKFYAHEFAAEDLSEIYFLKKAKKTCKPNNRDLNRNWIMLSSHKMFSKISKIDLTQNILSSHGHLLRCDYCFPRH